MERQAVNFQFILSEVEWDKFASAKKKKKKKK